MADISFLEDNMCMKVGDHELTLYYRYEVEGVERKDTCRICGTVTEGFKNMIFLVSAIEDSCVDIPTDSPLFNEAQDKLRKKLYHGLMVCESKSCERIDLKQYVRAL